MADNLVSKFTVNSQGTDIDVKIKDADARNLIAQEISDRASAVTTITNNLNKEISDRKSADTTITNNLNKEISDRSALISKDSEGNTTVNASNGSLYLNTKNPIKYSQPVSKLNDYFNTIPFVDNSGNQYNVLCASGNTVNLSSDNSFKNYILVGDSYAQGWTPDGSVTGWPELLHGLLKGNLYASVTQGGAGLSDKMTGIYNLTTRISELANNDNVDSIICCCGKNDINSGELVDGINNGIKNFVDACHQKFKNAKVYIGFIGWDLNKLPGWTIGKSLDLKNGIAAYERVTSDYTYLNTDFIMRQRSYLSSDGVHPNQAGQNALAYGIKCALYGGTPSYTKPFVQHTYPDANGGGNYQIKENFEGGTTFLQFTVDPSIEYKGTNKNVVFGNYELTIIKNVELDYIIPSGYNLTTMQARIMLQTADGTYYTLDVPAYFKSNSDGTYDLVINITEVNHAGNNWAGGIINYFQIYGSTCVGNPLT